MPRSSADISPEQKQAMAEGRRQSAIVRRYLDALAAHRPRRGRRRSPDKIRARLAEIEQELVDAEGMDELLLLQERKDLQRELERLEGAEGTDLSALEEEFVKVARAFAERRGIEYSTWREAGVPAAVLKRAGIRRTRSA